MSIPQPRLAIPVAGGHRAVREGRIHDLLIVAATGLLPLLLALAVAREVPKPNAVLAIGLIVGALGIVWLLVSTRYELTIGVLVLYLGLLDGPIKLLSGSQAASAIRNVLIVAVGLGMLARLIVSGQRVTLPPLFGWVLLFVGAVVVESANPNTIGVLKIAGGFRQQLQFVPFFFFAYVLMRSKRRFRKLFLILGVIALANGAVSTVQTRLSPAQVGSWGPGYSRLVEGAKGVGARIYSSGGEAHVRPIALGSDEGFGGAVGVIALPGLLALLASGNRRRRWLVSLLCMGALLAVATSLQRTTVLGAVVAAVSFVLLAFRGGHQMARPLMALVALVGLAVVMGAVLASAEGSGVFSRYASIASPEQAATTSIDYRGHTLAKIPSDIASAPFGVGLSSVGAGAGFGGKKETTALESRPSAESQYNYLTDELGLPGLIVWIAFSFKLFTLVVRRLPRVEDVELRLYIAAVAASLIAFAVMGFAGPTTETAAGGPFFWSAAGIIAYWLARSGRDADPTVLARPR